MLVSFLLKPLAIFLIMINSISAYFSVIIDKGMLLKSCIYVALVKISYGGFKSVLRSRVKIALSTLASAAVIFALMSKFLYHFLESTTSQAFYSHTTPSTLA